MRRTALLQLLLLWIRSGVAASASDMRRPNIVFIMADDMGWNDVSFHGSDQILTPNIDALAYSGVALQRYYSYCSCTPSRAALLTGKYAHRTGMQGYPLTNSEDRGIPPSERLLPEYLKALGYATHLVGKWHVGASREVYLPTRRGFDSHFGFRAGAVDYYEYVADETWSTGPVAGFDMYRNLSAAWDVEGYLTDILTHEAIKIISAHDAATPLYLHLAHAAPHSGASSAALLQAPPGDVRAHRHIALPERRILAGMMKKLDDSVGAVVKALLDKNILNNTIIAFVSDNGGKTIDQPQNWASNWPLRGQKMSPYEGGVRVAALVWSEMMSNLDHVWSGVMHVTDWLPTLLSAVGADVPEEIDGINQWQSILDLKPSRRNETIVDIDDYSGFSSIISGDYKLIAGTVNADYSKYLSGDLLEIIEPAPKYLDILKSSVAFEVLENTARPVDLERVKIMRTEMKLNCSQTDEICISNETKSCLYRILEDPCEQHDLSAALPELTQELTRKLMMEWGKRVPRKVPLYRDPASNPKLHNYTWAPWLD